jgi:hypothetical protein
VAYTVGQVVLEVSRQLNDQGATPYARWTQAELVQYLVDAIIQVGFYRPDALTQSTAMTLVPGATQTLPAGFSLLKSVDNNAASSNCPGSPVVEADLNILRTFYKKPCLPSGGDDNYRVRSFAYDSRNPQIFYVSPPVPTGVSGYQVTITAVGEAPNYTTADLNNIIAMDQKYHNALVAWMLARAYEVDTESATSFAMSQSQYKSFYNMLGVTYKQESLYKSGYYLGERGLKDPAPSRH